MSKPKLFNLSGKAMFFLVIGLLLLGYAVGAWHGYHVGYDERQDQDAKAVTGSAKSDWQIAGAGADTRTVNQ